MDGSRVIWAIGDGGQVTRPISRTRRYLTVALCTVLVGILGSADWFIGYEISFSIFYLLPISLTVLVAGFPLGVAIGALSAVSWYLADLHGGHYYSNNWIPIWNSGMRFGYFVLHSFFFSRFLSLYKASKRASLTDSVTGAANARAFYARLDDEVAKAAHSRLPFTLAYFDLDNFKSVNDAYGHHTGDEVLRTLTELANRCIGPRHMFARLGGDEFALLLSEADEDPSVVLIGAVQDAVLSEFSQRGWPVTMSIGMVTFRRFDLSPDRMLQEADGLMYEVKKQGKNAMEHRVIEQVRPLHSRAG